MIHIEVIGLEPPCKKCSELVQNAKTAAIDAGIEAEVVKLWVLADDVRQKYGLLLSPALVIDGAVVSQGKVYKPERIASLLQG